MLVFDQLNKGDRPLQWLALWISCGLLVLFCGVWYLQIMSTNRYVDSLKNQSLRKVRLPALRGKIVDRHGLVLSENRPCYNLNLYIEELSPLFQDMFKQIKPNRKITLAEKEMLGRSARYLVVSNVVQQLSNLMQQPIPMDPGLFQKHYTNRLALPLPLLENVTPEKIAVFLEQPHHIPGVSLDMQSLRLYPQAGLAANVLGYLRRTEQIAETEDEAVHFNHCLPDYLGVIGVEGAFDTELRGNAGAKAIMVNFMGYRRGEQVWSPTEPGYNVVLTIDARIQRVAESALKETGPDVKGAVVVMDCRSGDILAMVSAPSFDPNSFIPRITTENWEKLNDEETNPTLNRATYGSYPPGSIFKIIVALAGLESGDINPYEVYQSLGYTQLTPRSKIIKDTAGRGPFDLRRALMLSSNPYFINYGIKTGLTNIMNMGKRFCLGQRTGIPLNQEVSGTFPTEEYVHKMRLNGTPVSLGDIANLCIGQGYITVTPLQMAVMAAAVANGGKVLYPRLVQRLETMDPNQTVVIKSFEGNQIRNELNIDPRNLEHVRAGMLADVEENDISGRLGTGHESRVSGFKIAGKTGTAQVEKNGEVHHRNTWFVSFAPYESPRYAMAVLVEYGGGGGTTCAPVARKIYEVIKQIEENPGLDPLKPVAPTKTLRRTTRPKASLNSPQGDFLAQAASEETRTGERPQQIPVTR